MSKDKLENKIKILKHRLETEYCNVKNCNNKSKIKKEKIICFGKGCFKYKHFVCNKHKYHIPYLLKDEIRLQQDWDNIKILNKTP